MERKYFLIAICISAVALLAMTMGGFFTTPAPRSPFVGKSLYRPAVQACDLKNSSSPEVAAAAAFVCEQPTARWIIDDMRSWNYPLSTELEMAHASGTYPVIVLYNIPNRDCGLFASQEREVSSEEYLQWVTSIAKEIGEKEVAIILEPDALPQIVSQQECFEASGEKSAKERLRLIKEAVTILTKNPGTAVYIDAGNASWASSAEIAPLLKDAGIMQAHGFALNVSNRVSTPESIRYGKELSKLIQDRGFILDTSRNGNPAPRNPQEWCNPEDEALGELPTTATGDPLVHALLWVKGPGESDGECNKGDPPAGALSAERLLLLYTNSVHSQY